MAPIVYYIDTKLKWPAFWSTVCAAFEFSVADRVNYAYFGLCVCDCVLVVEYMLVLRSRVDFAAGYV